MVVNKVMLKMIEEANKNNHDINHFMKVHSFARIIGEQEGLDSKTLQTLEIASIIHDIACPLCRIKYGNTNGKNQEKESAVLVEEFLKNIDIDESQKKRINYLVCHHHTLTSIDHIDYQILIEADFLVNADESEKYHQGIEQMKKNIFKTKTGLILLNSIF